MRRYTSTGRSSSTITPVYWRLSNWSRVSRMSRTVTGSVQEIPSYLRSLTAAMASAAHVATSAEAASTTLETSAAAEATAATTLESTAGIRLN